MAQSHLARLCSTSAGSQPSDQAWREASGERRGFDEILIEAKRYVLANLLASEFTALWRLLARIAAGHYRTRDYAAERLRAALELFVLHFPVYRTYVSAAGTSAGRPRHHRCDHRQGARATGSVRMPGFSISSAMRSRSTCSAAGRHSRARVRRFAFKVQQFTGPMMAKSLEDTAFYRYHRLLALNEVGGDPACGGVSVADFHDRMTARAASFPHGLTATRDPRHQARRRCARSPAVPVRAARRLAARRSRNGAASTLP